MKAFFHHFSFEFKTGIRNKILLLMNYLFPLGFYLMMGFILPGINPLFLEVLIPAMIVFAILAATMLGLPDPLVGAREKGIFRTYKINGVPTVSILLIPALTTILHLAILATFIALSAPVLFDAPAPVDWVGFVITFLAATISCTGIAVLIGVFSASTRMTVLWAQLIFLPSMLLGGMMIPFSMLPEAAGKFAQLLPATYAMNAFNHLAMGAPADFDANASLLILLASGLLSFTLAVYLFSWDSKNAVRCGHPLLALLALLPFVAGIIFL